jgi:hypothetical protein
MTTDELVALLAWCGLALWVGALLVFISHKDRIAAILNAIMALPFLIMPSIDIIKWHSDPTAYVRQYGAAALGQLPVDGGMIGLALVALVGCALSIRGHRLWLIVPFLLNAFGLVVLFYLAYFFRIKF